MDAAQPRTDATALVLSGGGARGAYQVGVLAAIAERIDDEFPFPILTGVSAGAINAACLAGTQEPIDVAIDNIRRAWLDLSVEQVFRSGFIPLSASGSRWLWTLLTGGFSPGYELRGLLDTEPLRAYLGRMVDADGITRNRNDGRLRALALSTTSYATGQTITFIDCDASIETWERAGRRAVRARIDVDHVMASAALPLVFPAIRIDDRYYGDGSIRMAAPLAPAIHLGADRLLAVSVRHPRTAVQASKPQVIGYPPPAQVLGMLMNAVFLDHLAVDVERLERVNELVARCPAGMPPPDNLRHVDLLVLHPSRDLGELSADLGHHLPRAMRVLLRGLGANKLRSPDFLSYLLFERPYVERLIELGYDDGMAGWERIERFLER